MNEGEYSGINKFFFGSIRKKLLFSFGIIIILMIILSVSTFYLNENMRQLTLTIKDVSAPMDLMIQEIIGNDAILTGHAHWALIDAYNGNLVKINEHKAMYDEAGLKLDTLLKTDYRALLDKSGMALDAKSREESLLRELDRVNLALVDLETGAFDKMSKGDSNGAYALIGGAKYATLKKELSDLYTQLSITQKGFTNSLRDKVALSTGLVQTLNIILAIVIIAAGIIVMLLVSSNISAPVKKLQSAVKEIGKGNFAVRVEINTHDELSELGEMFNQVALTLSDTEEKRKEIDKIKTEFLSITSHELRSPMTPMRAQLQMLLSGYFGKLSPKQKESAEIVLRNTERLDKILMDFLEISRIEAARLKFSFVKTSLAPHIKRVIEELKGIMPEKKIVISLKMDSLPEFEVDPDRVMQVLRNLISNAVKFVPDFGGKIEVSVAAKADSLLFCVKDNGVGIADENKARIFEPFFQEEQTIYRKYQGTGLGLAICRGIIESQKGRIWFESRKGKGTKFFFTVPFTPVKEIAPIKVLFSRRAMVDAQLKKVMLQYLGPLGAVEFDVLKKNGLVEKAVIEYIDELYKSKIISNKEEFKKEVRALFNEKSDAK